MSVKPQSWRSSVQDGPRLEWCNTSRPPDRSALEGPHYWGGRAGGDENIFRFAVWLVGSYLQEGLCSWKLPVFFFHNSNGVFFKENDILRSASWTMFKSRCFFGSKILIKRLRSNNNKMEISYFRSLSCFGCLLGLYSAGGLSTMLSQTHGLISEASGIEGVTSPKTE